MVINAHTISGGNYQGTKKKDMFNLTMQAAISLHELGLLLTPCYLPQMHCKIAQIVYHIYYELFQMYKSYKVLYSM